MKKLILLAIFTLSNSSNALGADIVLESPEERMEYIRNSDVWIKPSWVGDDLSFSGSFDITREPEAKGTLAPLNREHVVCETTEELATRSTGTGKTEKFYCNLMDYDHAKQKWVVALTKKGKPKKIKVKYGRGNAEIPGELLGTRLLHALGFAADKMYAVKKLTCFGCTADPWNDRRVDPTTISGNGRLFEYVAIEEKAEGEEIVIREEDLQKPGFVNSGWRKREGFSYPEILNKANYSSDPSMAREQVIERDALMLISAFIRHADNKKPNQRLSCEGDVSKDGKCLGRVRLILQDLGATFGGGIKLPKGFSKVELRLWQFPMWKTEASAKSCHANLGITFNVFLMPQISEEARRLVGGLLSKFSEGELGRKRVENLFKYAMVEEMGRGKIDKWVEAFLAKVEEINYPLGRTEPRHTCPKLADSATRKVLSSRNP